MSTDGQGPCSWTRPGYGSAKDYRRACRATPREPIEYRAITICLIRRGRAHETNCAWSYATNPETKIQLSDHARVIERLLLKLQVFFGSLICRC